MNKTVKLNEAQLKKMVAESVKKALKESGLDEITYKTTAAAYAKAKQLAKQHAGTPLGDKYARQAARFKSEAAWDFNKKYGSPNNNGSYTSYEGDIDDDGNVCLTQHDKDSSGSRRDTTVRNIGGKVTTDSAGSDRLYNDPAHQHKSIRGIKAMQDLAGKATKPATNSVNESRLRQIVAESIKKVVKENIMDSDFERFYDMNGREIHVGDRVIWINPDRSNRDVSNVYMVDDMQDGIVYIKDKMGRYEEVNPSELKVR